jgi:hypothetical protein
MLGRLVFEERRNAQTEGGLSGVGGRGDRKREVVGEKEPCCTSSHLIPWIAHHEKYAEQAPIADITNTATMVVSL